MGPLFENFDSILNIPTGCGEQNLINIVPNVAVLNFLPFSTFHSKTLIEKYSKQALNQIELGVQRQMNYRRRDGSFSVFGEQDLTGSTWLTANVISAFVD